LYTNVQLFTPIKVALPPGKIPADAHVPDLFGWPSRTAKHLLIQSKCLDEKYRPYSDPHSFF